MIPAQHQQLVNFIWTIADDILRDVYKRGKYADVILPFTVLRRLDTVLKPTHDEVVAMNQKMEELNIQNRAPQLTNVSGYTFYNVSPFTLDKILEEPSSVERNMLTYLDGFSENLQQVVQRFSLRNHVRVLADSNRLFSLVERFCDGSTGAAVYVHLYGCV